MPPAMPQATDEAKDALRIAAVAAIAAQKNAALGYPPKPWKEERQEGEAAPEPLALKVARLHVTLAEKDERVKVLRRKIAKIKASLSDIDRAFLEKLECV
eukprot:g733.t1